MSSQVKSLSLYNSAKFVKLFDGRWDFMWLEDSVFSTSLKAYEVVLPISFLAPSGVDGNFI